MKKLMLVLMAIVLGFGLQAQDKGQMRKTGPKGDAQKFESMKIAHLTSALELTPEEAEKFWPVYNKWNDQKKALRVANRPEKKMEEMTQAEADAFIENTLSSRRKANELDAAMHEDLKGVLSATQRMKLIRAEDNFHQSVVKRFKKGRKGMNGAQRKQSKEAKETEKEKE